MIVGESAGIDESSVLNFKGASGKLLESVLKEQQVKREDVYITYAVKCHTPGGRPPEKEELKSCKKYLLEEIAVVKPEIIITLGNVALNQVTGHSGIMNWRGKECELDTIMVIPTLSPGAVLRNLKYMTLFKADIAKAISILNGHTSKNYEPVIHYVMNKETLKELIVHLENASKIENIIGACDLETTTFDYWRPETKVMTMGLCIDEKHCWAIPLEHPQSPWRNQSEKVLAFIKPYLERKIKWAGNNWKFDNKWMRSKYGITVNFGPDNMLISYANNENIPHDLKWQADYWCKAGQYDKDIHWPKKFDPVVDNIVDKVTEYGKMDLKKMLKYNALDAYYSKQVYPLERNELLKDIRSARIYKHLLENGSHIFMEIEENGMWVDPDRLKNAYGECEIKIQEIRSQLDTLIPEGWMERNLNKKQLKGGFNWNSTQQLGKLFFQEDGFNFPVLQRTGKGAPSTSESVLIALGAEIDHPAIELLGEYRKWSKYMSTYLQPWSAKVDGNNRLHPTFKLHGTVTGRLSGEDGVHQVPRDNFIRRLIGAPPGWSFLEIDGSQIELRVAASVSMESTMIRIYATNGDIHRTTASTVTGKPESEITGVERKKAKAVNFGFLYGMGWRKFKIYAWEKYGVRLSDDEAKAYRTRFFNLYSDLPEWHARMRRLVRACGYVVSPIGRRRRLPDIFSNDEQMQAAAEREAINSPVQGLGSDIVLACYVDLIMNILPSKYPNWREFIKPVGAVHDAQYWEIKNEYLLEIAQIIKEAFDDQSRLKKWFGYELPLPMIGDIKVGNHWGDSKEWEIGTPLPFERR